MTKLINFIGLLSFVVLLMILFVLVRDDQRYFIDKHTAQSLPGLLNNGAVLRRERAEFEFQILKNLHDGKVEEVITKLSRSLASYYLANQSYSSEETASLLLKEIENQRGGLTELDELLRTTGK